MKLLLKMEGIFNLGYARKSISCNVSKVENFKQLTLAK